MGDPKKLRKKYEPPRHPWQASRIESEKILFKEYGLKNKKEIWKAQSLLRNFAKQAKNLVTVKTQHDKKQKEQLLNRLIKLDLLKDNSQLEDVLGLNLKNVLDRRLQTMLVKRGLTKTAKQARQFIVHGHVTVKGQKINIPGYLVSKDEEDAITFSSKSKLNDAEHPERIVKKEK